MPKLHLYVVHTASLIHRQPRLHGTIQNIREIATNLGYEFRSILVLSPDIGPLQANIQQLSDRVKYEDTGFPDLDSRRSIVNIEQLSNYEKHREVWRRMQKEVTSEEDMCMVLEDDAMIIPEFQTNMHGFLRDLFKQTWDFHVLSVSIPGSMSRIADSVRMLPSKCAYVIKPSARVLNTLLDETEVIRFNLRLQLSYIFLKRPEIKAMIGSTQSIMEGSKVGMYPSSVHPSNMLVFNQEYMDLFNMMASPNIQKATAIFDGVKHIPNPDILHIYAVILYKCGKVKEAAQLLSTAVEWMQKQHGMINSQSDLLNNAINMYENMQWDLPQYFSEPSKYDSILEPLRG